MTKPKILVLDIETAPIQAQVWGLWQQNVALNQITNQPYILSYAMKWLGEPARTTQFFGRNTLLEDELPGPIWEAWNEADALVHFNGDRFDIPWLKKDFQQYGYGPPAPAKNIDILKVVKKNFRLPSNKLQYVSTWLGLEGKAQHTGHKLWVDCMNGDAKAWKLMEKYNKQDVVLLEKVYDKLLPWIHNGLNRNLFDGLGCPNCGSANLQKRGFAYTSLGKYQRMQCQACGTWSKDSKRIDGTSTSRSN